MSNFETRQLVEQGYLFCDQPVLESDLSLAMNLLSSMVKIDESFIVGEGSGGEQFIRAMDLTPLLRLDDSHDFVSLLEDVLSQSGDAVIAGADRIVTPGLASWAPDSLHLSAMGIGEGVAKHVDRGDGLGLKMMHQIAGASLVEIFDASDHSIKTDEIRLVGQACWAIVASPMNAIDESAYPVAMLPHRVTRISCDSEADERIVVNVWMS